MENLHGWKTSAPPNQTKIVNDALLQLGAQWSIDANTITAKREALALLLEEVGNQRFDSAIQSVLVDYKGSFCPSIAQIRSYVPARLDDDQQKARNVRLEQLRIQTEFDRLLCDIRHLQRNADRADNAKLKAYFLFQHGMHCGILHWWLREAQHKDYVNQLCELAWVTDEAQVNRYAEEVKKVWALYKTRPYYSEQQAANKSLISALAAKASMPRHQPTATDDIETVEESEDQ